jgi:hypothetical protein
MNKMPKTLQITKKCAGHSRAQPGTTGHNRAQPGTTGHNRAQPGTTTGHNRAQPGTTGHNRAPHPGTTGHNRAQPGTTGHNRAQRRRGEMQGQNQFRWRGCTFSHYITFSGQICSIGCKSSIFHNNFTIRYCFLCFPKAFLSDRFYCQLSHSIIVF